MFIGAEPIYKAKEGQIVYVPSPDQMPGQVLHVEDQPNPNGPLATILWANGSQTEERVHRLANYNKLVADVKQELNRLNDAKEKLRCFAKAWGVNKS